MATQGLHQVQKQTQSLVLAPQLRQSLKILQVPALELRNTILEELQANPALEELPMEGVSIEDSNSRDDSADLNGDGGELQFDDNYEMLSRMDEDAREYYREENGYSSYSSEDAERRQHFFDSLTSETSLQEHLISQAHLADTSPQVIEALEYLVGSLDDRGFLTSSISDIALVSNLPLKSVQDAHQLLKSLDPPGIGSANLQDCLLTQLKLNNEDDSLAATLIKEHFDLLLRRRIPDLARKLGANVDDIQYAIEKIAALDPAPGRKFADDSNRVVEPDVKVEKDGDNWLVILNNDYIPRLRLSSIYKDMIAKGKLSRKEKEYIQEKIRSGKFLMSSIEQRQQTIERITRAILKFQNDFFENGVSSLRPLTMNQVAEEVGVHETTVSRAIANKYIDTPHGIFDFKYFFTTGYTSNNGKAVANTTVKDLIAKIIESENPAKPYSDQDVVNILKEKDVKIARRTVAKYREELGILPTNLRRQY